MTVAFTKLVGAETAPQETDKKPSSNFWREFVRVQSDKFLLLGLLIYLHHIHAEVTLQATTLGGLIVLIQGQRFKLS